MPLLKVGSYVPKEQNRSLTDSANQRVEETRTSEQGSEVRMVAGALALIMFPMFLSFSVVLYLSTVQIILLRPSPSVSATVCMSFRFSTKDI